MRDYIAFDIENPNAKGNSICSMGIVIVKDNKVVDKKYYLVNPEDRFDIRNKEITGITESMTFDKPTLQEIWPEIERLFLENVIVGHNVTYDLAVLSKSLLRYNIVPPDFKYCCTLRLSRSNMEAKSYKLSSLMEMLEYEYDAHNALADALAAQYLFEIICKSFTATPLSYHYEKVVKETMDEKLSKNINSLNGIINGIIADDAVNDKEIQRLKKWV